MENLTVTLETAKKLKAAGFGQDTHFMLVPTEERVEGVKYLVEDWRTVAPDSRRDWVAAPTAQELLKELPMGIDLFKGDFSYSAGARGYPDLDGTADSAAEALAILWLKHHEADR